MDSLKSSRPTYIAALLKLQRTAVLLECHDWGGDAVSDTRQGGWVTLPASDVKQFPHLRSNYNGNIELQCPQV